MQSKNTNNKLINKYLQFIFKFKKVTSKSIKKNKLILIKNVLRDDKIIIHIIIQKIFYFYKL